MAARFVGTYQGVFTHGSRALCRDCGHWITLAPVETYECGEHRYAWLALTSNDCTRPESDLWGHRPIIPRNLRSRRAERAA